MVELPPFPVDDATLDLLMAAISPWDQGHPDAKRSNLWDFLTLMSQMGGSDTEAVVDLTDCLAENQADDRIVMMRDPMYTDHCVITALVAEVRRLRAEVTRAQA